MASCFAKDKAATMNRIRVRRCLCCAGRCLLGASLAVVAPTARAQNPATPVAKPQSLPANWTLWQEIFGSPSASVPSVAAPPIRSVSLPQAAVVRWEPLARTPDNRVMEFAQFGTGDQQVLVVGSLAGDQPEGTALAEYLAAHLTRFPKRLTDVTVTVLRDPNPDGRARRAWTNARGVDLDRNFPTVGWNPQTPGVRGNCGARAGSEMETRALVDLLQDLQPDRVILLGPGSKEPELRFTGAADKLVRLVADESQVKVMPNDPRRLPGSLLSYCGDDLGIPTVRLGLVPKPSADEIWSTYKRALLTAIGCGTPTEFPEVVTRFGPRRAPRKLNPPTPAAAQTVANPYLPSSPVTNAAPVTSLPAASQTAGSTSAGPTGDPLPLRFQNVSHGLPTVSINNPYVPQPTVAPMPVAQPIEVNKLPVVAVEPAPPSSAPTPEVQLQPIVPQLQRLPSVNVLQPRPIADGSTSPPRSYPATGK